MRLPPGALVVAAGEGRRMGGPKALLLMDGRPLVLRHLERLREVGCAPVVLVTRPSVAAALDEEWRADAGLHVVSVETQSPAASIAMGLRAVAASGIDPFVRSWLVTPVDLMPPRAATLGALLARLEAGALAVTPTCQGRGGHPVAVEGELLSSLLIGPLEGLPSLRDLLHAAGPRRLRLPVDDVAVLGDLDTPSDGRVLGEDSPRFFAAGLH